MLKAFEDPKATSRNPATLAARTGVPLAAATAFLRDQAASQITKEAHKPPDENYAPTGGPRGEYLADVIYLREYAGVNKKRTCILTLLGVNSRFVYARALTAADSKKTAEALTEILAQNDQDVRGGVVARIGSIRSDGGGEFKGEFAALLEERSIPLTKGQPRTHSGWRGWTGITEFCVVKSEIYLRYATATSGLTPFRGLSITTIQAPRGCYRNSHPRW